MPRFLIDGEGALRILPMHFRLGADLWACPGIECASPSWNNVNGARVTSGHLPEGVMTKKKGIPDDDFGPIPDDEVDKYDEDDKLFDDDLEEDDLDEDEDDDEFDDEFEEEEYDDDEDDLEEVDGVDKER